MLFSFGLHHVTTAKTGDVIVDLVEEIDMEIGKIVYKTPVKGNNVLILFTELVA